MNDSVESDNKYSANELVEALRTAPPVLGGGNPYRNVASDVYIHRETAAKAADMIEQLFRPVTQDKPTYDSERYVLVDRIAKSEALSVVRDVLKSFCPNDLKIYDRSGGKSGEAIFLKSMQLHGLLPQFENLSVTRLSAAFPELTPDKAAAVIKMAREMDGE